MPSVVLEIQTHILAVLLKSRFLGVRSVKSDVRCFSTILAIAVLGFAPTAWALDDGWYEAKSATGSCTGPMMRSTVAVDQGAPVSLSFTSESFSFPIPIKPSKSAKTTKMTGSGEQFDVSLAEVSKNKLTIKLIGGECRGAQVVYEKK
ncbi:MAG: hypothetical protein WCO61_13405 [Alphaproteobacteria bacterium]